MDRNLIAKVSNEWPEFEEVFIIFCTAGIQSGVDSSKKALWEWVGPRRQRVHVEHLGWVPFELSATITPTLSICVWSNAQDYRTVDILEEIAVGPPDENSWFRQ